MRKILQILIVLLINITIDAQIGGYAIKFDGINDQAARVDGPISDNTDLTLEAWIYIDPTASGEMYLIQQREGGGDNGFRNEYVFKINSDNSIDFFDYGYSAYGFSDQPNSGLYLPKGTWTHIAVSVDNYTGKATYYINGENRREESRTGSQVGYNGNLDFFLGRDGRDFNKPFKGKLDEVRIWNTARTEAEIKSNIYKELAGTETGLVAYYKMSDGTGTTITDNKSGGTKSLTMGNGTIWTASGCFAGSRNALDFDGTDDYVNCGSSTLFNMSGAVTIEAWVNINNTSAGMFVAGKFEHTGGREGYGLFINSFGLGGGAGKVTFISGQNWSNWWGVTSETSIEIDKWTHIAGTFDGRYLKVYINGVLEKITDIGSVQSIVNSEYNFSIGKRIFQDTDKFKGKIDEVRVWNTVRDESQIRENMMRNLISNETDLVAYYRFDQYDGTTLYDLTGEGNNGTLTNMDAATDWVTSSAFNTWIGGESTTWTTAANWSGGVPTTINNVGLYKWDLDNITTYNVSQIVSFITNSLFISTTSNPTLPSTFTVNGSFVLGKNYDITDKQITLGSSGYLREGDYRLYGTSGTITTTRELNLITNENIGGLGAVISSAKKTYTVSGAGSDKVNGTYQYLDIYNGKNRYTKGEGEDECWIAYNYDWYIWAYGWDDFMYTYDFMPYYISNSPGLDNDPPTDGWSLDYYSGTLPVPTVSYTNPQFMGSTTITRGHAEQTQNSNKSIKRYYLITPENNTNLDATLVFKYHTDELNGLTEDNLTLFKETSENVWTAQESSVLDAVNNKLTLTGISSFSKWTAAENSAFPVELKSLSATTRNNKVIIAWQTATEINNYGFEIERAKIDAKQTNEYLKIGFVVGHGNSNALIEYTFIDESVSFGKYTYRLKQIDNDGKFSYTNSVEVELNNITNYRLIQNYPNPFNPTTTISYELPKSSMVTIKVYDILGNEVALLVNGMQELGHHNIKWDAGNLSSGIYFYTIKADEFIDTKKMLLAK